MKNEQLTEQSIQQRLNYFFASYKYKADGLYVFSWESDKLIWTKSGYIYEFEIKISRSDFKNDFKHKKEKHIVLASTIDRDKAKEIQMSLFEQKEQENRHWSREMLESRYGDIDAMVKGKRMPNYFYYAVPTGMLEPDEVPPYAGLIYIDSEYRYVKQSYRIVKEAPQLHKTKYTDAELNLGEKFYYNWQTGTTWPSVPTPQRANCSANSTDSITTAHGRTWSATWSTTRNAANATAVSTTSIGTTRASTVWRYVCCAANC